ncbi:mitochondrial protein C2orf69 homolog [Oscarella lobularis]|uniref:mitochondrial protein C2orf69 homolog n=1 Tax=Oscarella lobularis TaxID=121494 RepID=UPI0033140C74
MAALKTAGKFSWLDVKGIREKPNHVLHYARLESPKQAQINVLYFPGDVQEREDVMATGPNKEWTSFSYESTAARLAERFSDSNPNVFVVRPTRIVKETFSCFDNFVSSGIVGAPRHETSFGAWSHAIALIGQLERQSQIDDELPWTLIGFSKGCVVLNQLCFEMAAMETLDAHGDDSSLLGAIRAEAKKRAKDFEMENVRRFYSRIREFYWLDGGHSGEENTWVTDETTLQVVARLVPRVRVHVTPYQMKDKSRPWLGKEEGVFVSTLKRFGADVIETVHFENRKRSLGIHFELLDSF